VGCVSACDNTLHRFLFVVPVSPQVEDTEAEDSEAFPPLPPHQDDPIPHLNLALRTCGHAEQFQHVPGLTAVRLVFVYSMPHPCVPSTDWTCAVFPTMIAMFVRAIVDRLAVSGCLLRSC